MLSLGKIFLGVNLKILVKTKQGRRAPLGEHSGHPCCSSSSLSTLSSIYRVPLRMPLCCGAMNLIFALSLSQNKELEMYVGNTDQIPGTLCLVLGDLYQ